MKFEPMARPRGDHPKFGGFRRPGAKFLFVNIGLISLLIFGAIEPLVNALDDGAAAVAELRGKLDRYQAIVDQAGPVEAYAARVASQVGAREFIAGDSDGMVAANLQARLKTLAEGAKVSVRSVQMLPSKTVEDLMLFGARLEVVGSLESIHALVRKIESGGPVLVIAEADIRKESPMTTNADEILGIEARLDVFGAASPETKPEDGAETRTTKEP